MNPPRFPIIFCGAGPGDPELITVKGQKALSAADLILYAGSLVPAAVLVWAPETTERISSADMDLQAIVETMTTAYGNGRKVVRLHTGDPSLYGAVREQMDALDARGIPFEVIPGVTAAFAAAAAMGIEYTLPGRTQTLIMTRMAGRTPVPGRESLASLAAHGASLVIYLSMGLLDQVVRVLTESYGPQAPCAIAYRVSHPEERLLRTDVAHLAEAAREAKISRLAVVMVGPALEDFGDGDELRSRLYDKAFSHGYRS